MILPSEVHRFPSTILRFFPRFTFPAAKAAIDLKMDYTTVLQRQSKSTNRFSMISGSLTTVLTYSKRCYKNEGSAERERLVIRPVFRF